MKSYRLEVSKDGILVIVSHIGNMYFNVARAMNYEPETRIPFSLIKGEKPLCVRQDLCFLNVEGSLEDYPEFLI